jgi:hypothetical protein
VFTVLLSYGAPVFPRKLREWLDGVLCHRDTAEPDVRSALVPAALPDLIVSMSGTLAAKAPSADR